METYDRDALTEVLMRMDEEVLLELGEPAQRYRIIIVGGSAFMLSDLTQRAVTYDIDVLDCDASIRRILSRYRMINGRVCAFMDKIPYGFENRLITLGLPTKAIEVLVPCPEDLVVMKLYAWRENDQADLTSSEVLSQMDWELLGHLVYDDDEAKASNLSERSYDEMVAVYERYVRRYNDEAEI